VDISKSAVTTMGLTIEDKHFITWLWVKVQSKILLQAI